MAFLRSASILILISAAVLFSGCRAGQPAIEYEPASSVELLSNPIAQTVVTDEAIPTRTINLSPVPLDPSNYRPLALDEAINIALADPQVLRSLGATSIDTGTQASTSFEPAINSTDPNFGISAALADFDGSFSANTFFEKNDDVFNNSFLGGGATEVREDLTSATASWSRTNQSGTRLSYVNRLEHLDSNNPNLLFASSFRNTSEFTVRHPLLQGSGMRFNQIAGPNNQPGFRNRSGLVVSRISNEISQSQFEQRVRDMVQEIAIAYWRLDLAYRSYESAEELKNAAEQTLMAARTKQESGLVGGEVDRVAQAEEQFYQFEVLAARSLTGSQNTGQLGIYEAEANLRRLLNLRVNDGVLLKPSDERTSGEVVYDGDSLLAMATQNRVEIREQRLRVRQRELELEAAKNFLLPRLDAVATYRNNGFGHDLAGGSGRFSSAFKDAFSNDHGEWELGLTYDIVSGQRVAKAAVRNAELALRRERAILRDQQEQLAHDLAAALRDIDLNLIEIKLNAKRSEAAKRTLRARQVAYEADKVGFDELLDAQRRLLESQLEFDQVRSNYEIAKESLMLISGELLAQHGVVIDQPDCLYDPVIVAKIDQIPNTIPTN